MATGVPPKSGMKRGEVSVSLTYEGKKTFPLFSHNRSISTAFKFL